MAGAIRVGSEMGIGPRSNGRAGSGRLEWWQGKGGQRMNIFYLIGVVVVVLAVFGYIRLG
jgi:hypothetical protein